MRMTIHTAALLSPLLLVLGCAKETSLRPAHSAEGDVRSEEQKAAAQADEQVMVVAQTDAWEAEPENLEEEVIPLRLTIRNNSDRNVLVRYEDMELQTRDGKQIPALPPFMIRGAVADPQGTKYATKPADAVIEPKFKHHHFKLGEGYDAFYEEVSIWRAPVSYDESYHELHYTRWEQPLPTMDMMEQAIPEGVLEPDGNVEGFVYFGAAAVPSGELLQLRMNLVDAETGEAFGTVTFDFQTVRDNV